MRLSQLRRLITATAVIALAVIGFAIVPAGATPTDTTAPTVNLKTPADGAKYGQNTVVKASYTCSDTGGSGLGVCAGTMGNGATIVTQTLGAHTFSVWATDGAGNLTKVTHTYTVVDLTPPSITISTPASGAVYATGAVVNASFSCADEPAGSKIATCVGTVANGSPVSTNHGLHTFTVTATDNAGNKTTKSVKYSAN